MSELKAQLQNVVVKLGIPTHTRHVFLCTGPNCCTPEQGQAAWDVLKQQIKEHNLGGVCNRTKVGCLRICEQGPTALVYPEGTWYHGMTAERVKYWEIFGTLKWGIMCMTMYQAFAGGADRSVERAAIGRRSSETEVDLVNLLYPKGTGT